MRRGDVKPRRESSVVSQFDRGLLEPLGEISKIRWFRIASSRVPQSLASMPATEHCDPDTDQDEVDRMGDSLRVARGGRDERNEG
jgi:hypothetical protein